MRSLPRRGNPPLPSPGFSRWTIGFLILLMLRTGAFPTTGEAIVLPSDFGAVQTTEEKDRIRTHLETKVLRRRLLDLGLDDTTVETKLRTLTDEEIHLLAQHTELLLPGGDALGFVVGVLIVGVLVVILLELTGHRIIVTR